MKPVTNSWLLVVLLVMAFSCGDPMADDCIDSSKVDPDGMCIEIFEPVCGCNGVTYSNACFASIAGLTSWSSGSCSD